MTNSSSTGSVSSSTISGMPAPTNSTDWAIAILSSMGITPTKNNITDLVGWMGAEGSNTYNNPLNTTLAVTGSQSLPGNSSGVQMYPTPEVGLAATVNTLQNYPTIISALKNNADVTDFANTVASTDWCVSKGAPCGTPYANNIVATSSVIPTPSASTVSFWSSLGNLIKGELEFGASGATAIAGSSSTLLSPLETLAKSVSIINQFNKIGFIGIMNIVLGILLIIVGLVFIFKDTASSVAKAALI